MEELNQASWCISPSIGIFFMVKAFKISLKISSPLCIINYDHHSYIVAILNSPLQSVILYTYQHLTCRCSASL